MRTDLTSRTIISLVLVLAVAAFIVGLVHGGPGGRAAEIAASGAAAAAITARYVGHDRSSRAGRR